MKTKNNVQKAILRSAAVIVSFVLISFTVSAQDFWKRLIENSSFNDIALAMVKTEKHVDYSDANVESLEAMYFETELESNLEIESWMTEVSKFDVSVFSYSQDHEPNLEVEEWMMNESVFQTTSSFESALEMEDWMTSEQVWKM